MTTTFGKELRKLRIDCEETICDMAKKLEISISYLSSIESGIRNIPSDLVEKIINIYSLDYERSERLRQAEVESIKEISVDLSNFSIEQKKLAYNLARKLPDLSEQDCLKILDEIKKWAKLSPFQ